MEKWHIIKTRPRWEKKVADSLLQKGMESYCPVRKVKRKWSDRIKTLEEPVFKSCVFVKIPAELRTAVRLTEGVVNFVYENGKPAIVKEKQIDQLQKCLQKAAQENGGEEKAGMQHPAFLVYLERFQLWLLTCLDRPKLV